MKFFSKKQIVSKKNDLLGPALRVMKGSMKVDFNYNLYNSQNIFNLISSESDYGFYYWPYGYLFRHFRWGGVNSLGFRCPEELEDIIGKYADYYRIAFFGGSTGFDVLVPDNETLVTQLETMLNQSPVVKERLKKNVKIFNLSQPGNLVLNQIINFIQFGHLIKPHLVICHSAANDLCTMQMNDPRLVGLYHIGYPDVLEAWAKKIHNATRIDIDYQFSDPSRPTFRPARDRVTPNVIIEAYSARVHQFAKVACSEGVNSFLVGFQPWVTSKAKNSQSEARARKTYNPYYKTIYRNVESLYKLYSKTITDSFKPLAVADIHSHFYHLSSDLTHFGDTHHMLGLGNKEGAFVYAKKIEELIA